MTRHALYANAEDGRGRRLTFRIGQPVDWDRAIRRWERLDDARYYRRRSFTVRHDGRRFAVRSFEVRAVDAVGRGLGSERHEHAFPVPFRLCRIDR